MSVPAQSHLTMDLENELKEDTSGEFKKKLHDGFSQQISAIDSQLKKGVAPDEYACLNTIMQGLQSADVVLERIWIYYHHQ